LNLEGKNWKKDNLNVNKVKFQKKKHLLFAGLMNLWSISEMHLLTVWGSLGSTEINAVIDAEKYGLIIMFLTRVRNDPNLGDDDGQEKYYYLERILKKMVLKIVP
jgi:hypothetical protein